MNRRSFLFQLSAIAAAPVLAKPSVETLPATQADPATKLVPVSVLATDSLSKEVADMQRMADWLRGDHPLRLRFFSLEKGEARFEFDVLESFTYTSPAGIDLNMPNRAAHMGDILSISVRGFVVMPMGADAASALRQLNEASNEIYRRAPKTISITPLNLP